MLLIAWGSDAGAKLRVEVISLGRWGIGKGYVGCVDLGMLVSLVLSSSLFVVFDFLVGGGAKKLSSVLGRFAVFIFLSVRLISRMSAEDAEVEVLYVCNIISLLSFDAPWPLGDALIENR